MEIIDTFESYKGATYGSEPVPQQVLLCEVGHLAAPQIPGVHLKHNTYQLLRHAT